MKLCGLSVGKVNYITLLKLAEEWLLFWLWKSNCYSFSHGKIFTISSITFFPKSVVKLQLYLTILPYGLGGRERWGGYDLQVIKELQKGKIAPHKILMSKSRKKHQNTMIYNLHNFWKSVIGVYIQNKRKENLKVILWDSVEIHGGEGC